MRQPSPDPAFRLFLDQINNSNTLAAIVRSGGTLFSLAPRDEALTKHREGIHGARRFALLVLPDRHLGATQRGAFSPEAENALRLFSRNFTLSNLEAMPQVLH